MPDSEVNKASPGQKSVLVEESIEIFQVAHKLGTQSCKRPGNMPVSQPNIKGPKCNSSTKSASTKIISVSNLPQSQTLSSKICTQNKTRLALSQISANFLPRTAGDENVKHVTRVKKQELSSKDTGDSVPSAKQLTRHQANIKKIKVKRSATSTSSILKTVDKNLDAPITDKRRTRVKFAK